MVAVLGWLFLAPSLQYEMVVVEHQRASVFAEKMGKQFTKLEFRTDDDRGRLWFRGPEDEVENFKLYTTLVDILPRRVRVKLQYASDIDRRQGKAELEADNNQPLVYTIAALKMDTWFAPRINDDNTVTLLAKIKYENRIREFTVRMLHGQPRTLYLTRKGPSYQWEPPKPGEEGTRTLPVIQIELSIVDN